MDAITEFINAVERCLEEGASDEDLRDELESAIADFHRIPEPSAEPRMKKTPRKA